MIKIAHKTLIGGTAYDVAGGNTMVGGTGYSIGGGRTLADGTGYDVSFETQIGTLAVGSIVTMTWGSTAKEFIVIHQGLPSSLYDSSCDGTWLLMKDICQTRPWYSESMNSYKDSTIHTVLNNTSSGPLASFAGNIKSIIKRIKIPYVNGTGSSGSVASGSSGLSTKLFLLSGYEVGLTNSDDPYLPVDGAGLDYFTSGNISEARIAYLDGTATTWWLRSPSTMNNTSAFDVRTNGAVTRDGTSWYFGLRPALVLPKTALVDGNYNVIG